MAITLDMVRRVTASVKAGISREDAERVLEIACLAIVSDGTIAPEEESVLRIVGEDIGARTTNVNALLSKVAALGARDAQLERLRAVADALKSDVARQLAYKVTVLTAMADLAASDEEFEFDIDVQDALQLSAGDADRLTGEVHEAVTVED
jgi:hypothetical protein